LIRKQLRPLFLKIQLVYQKKQWLSRSNKSAAI
jgi:hypothetical protein